jgi:hypothetical protein
MIRLRFELHNLSSPDLNYSVKVRMAMIGPRITMKTSTFISPGASQSSARPYGRIGLYTAITSLIFPHVRIIVLRWILMSHLKRDEDYSRLQFMREEPVGILDNILREILHFSALFIYKMYKRNEF